MTHAHDPKKTGVAYGIAAYAAWGVAPVYFKAVAHDQVLQASLGYFINPLVNVLLGYMFLRERLRPRQIGSVALASVGVLTLTLSYGHVPWLALTLAGSFAFYGLLRKTANVEALVGLTIETSILAPVALGYLIYVGAKGEGTFRAESIQVDVLLMAAGIVTAVPLIWFTNAARRLRLATLGFLQYLAPTGHFLLAVVAYHEPFTRTHLVSFSCIWAALLIYSLDMRRALRDARPSLPE